MSLAAEHNFCFKVFAEAAKKPQQLALKIPVMDKQQYLSESSMSFEGLLERVSEFQAFLKHQGLASGDKVMMIARPSVDFYALVLALLALGMVPVFVDAGMGYAKIRRAISNAQIKALIGQKAALKYSWMIPELWGVSKWSLDGGGLLYKQVTLNLVADSKPEIHAVDSQHQGIISFTSGSTGLPKGADRTHLSLIRQHQAILRHWPNEPDAIDFPCFPVLVLHNLSCAMTTVMPKLDLAQPAAANAQLIIDQIKQEGISRLSGAPAYIARLTDYLINSGQQVLSVDSIVIGGAPVEYLLAEQIQHCFPNAHSRIVYGSTEAEPIADIDISDFLIQAKNNLGYLVGRPSPETEVMISQTDTIDCPTEAELIEHKVQANVIGEIFVSGAHVLSHYVANPDANARNKIARAYSDFVWHRTGDIGFFDESGMLWLAGRSKYLMRVNNQVIAPFIIERQLNELSGVIRSALVQVHQECYLFLELELECEAALEKVKQPIIEVLLKSAITSVLVSEIDKLPVDKRHNSKINREQLMSQAESSDAQQWSVV